MTWESVIVFLAVVWLAVTVVVLAGWGLYVFGRYAAGELRYELAVRRAAREDRYLSAVRRAARADRDLKQAWTDPLVPWIAEPKDKR